MDEREPERAYGARIISHEAESLSALASSLGGAFIEAVDLLDSCARAGGTVLVTGLGKSGLIGAKISATLASLGIPSHSVHPSEAAHGDLGRFRSTDTALCLSYSGETEEVVNLASILRQDGLPIVAITGKAPLPDQRPPTLARLAKVTLTLGVDREAGEPELLAPSSSTTAMLALGDALALTLARRRRFTTGDFAKRHPGGALGSQLRPVTDVMRFRIGKNLTPIDDGLTLAEALERASCPGGRRPGAMLLIDPDSGRLTGIFTDGDLRRLVMRRPEALGEPVRTVMTRDPRSLDERSLVRDAVRLVREHRQDEVPVIDAQGRPLGILDVQDLITLRLVSD